MLAWMDGSLFFRGILRFFALLGGFFKGSFLVRLFSADFDEEWLRESRFVCSVERAFNLFPKLRLPRLPLPRLLEGSVLLSTFTEAMNTGLPAWALLAVVALTPFLPTMLLAGMLVLTFGMSLFWYRFRLDLTGVALVLFVVITMFFGLGSLARGTSLPIAVLTSVFMLSYLLARHCFSTRRSVDFVVAVMVTAAAVTGLVALYQVAIGYVNMTWVDRGLFAALGLRVYSTFGNPNVYGAYLLLVIPPAGALVFYARHWFLRLTAFGITGLLLVALALTYSRGCHLALAVSVLVFVLLIEKRMIVLYLAGLAAMPFVLPASIIARLVSIVNFADTSTAFRLNIWIGSLRVLGDFWMAGLGQGLEAYNAVYPFYALSATPSPHSHNLFLQIFLETGVVGLLVFVVMLACFFRAQFSFMRHCGDFRMKVMSAAFTAAAVGFLFQGMFDHVFYNYRVMLSFFLFMGVANSFVSISVREEL